MSKISASKRKAREYSAQVEKECPKLKVFMYFWLKIFECAWTPVSNNTLSEPDIRIRSKKSFRSIFFIFFHIFPIAKWYGNQISAIVVRILLWSSFCKLFSWKFWQIADKNHNLVVWATGSVVSTGSFHNLILQLN